MSEPRAQAQPTFDVVRIIARLNVGGPALHVIGVTDALSPRYRTALVFGDVDASEADMSDRAHRRGLSIYRIPQLGRRVRPWQDLVALVQLIRYLRRVRPRIVHTHTAKAGALGRIAAIVARVPIRVHTFHGHVLQGYFSRPVSALIALIERTLARFTTTIITISNSQARAVVEEYRICRRDQVRVMPLGLDLAPFYASPTNGKRQSFRAEVGAADKDMVITTVGRLVPIKNHDLFIDAAARLQAAGRNCVFVIVGGGPLADKLKRRATIAGLGQSVRFLGWRDDLPVVYAGSDIVALTSLNEGTPVSLIEALAAGKPVVATDVGGVSDVLEQGYLGLLVPSGNAAAFAGAIAQVIDDVQRRRHLSERGPEAVRARFSLERLSSDMGQLYDELLGRSTVTVSFSEQPEAQACIT